MDKEHTRYALNEKTDGVYRPFYIPLKGKNIQRNPPVPHLDKW